MRYGPVRFRPNLLQSGSGPAPALIPDPVAHCVVRYVVCTVLGARWRMIGHMMRFEDDSPACLFKSDIDNLWAYILGDEDSRSTLLRHKWNCSSDQKSNTSKLIQSHTLILKTRLRPGKLFLKPFLKGKILRSSERGVNSILTTILHFWPTSWRDRIFCLVASNSARRKDHFQKKNCPKRTFPSNFVKLVSKIYTLFIFGRKNGRLLLLFVVCCLLFVATLSDFGLLFF